MELHHLEGDLEERDLVQAELRLFGLVSSLLLELSSFHENEMVLTAALQVQQGHRRFQEPVCDRYRCFIDLWIRQSRSAIQRAKRQAAPGWAPAVLALLEEQHQAVSDWIFTRDEDQRLLSVRELMRLVDDAAALGHLRQACRALERYRDALVTQLEAARVAKEPAKPEVEVPDWQQQIDYEHRVLGYYARKLQEIEADETLSPQFRDELIERISALRDQTHGELMQPESSGDEPCALPVDADHLPDNIHQFLPAMGG